MFGKKAQAVLSPAMIMSVVVSLIILAVGGLYATRRRNSKVQNRAKTVKSRMDNTVVSYNLNGYNHRNAYQLKLEREYNTGTSVRHPNFRMKIYAELIGNYENMRIKNLMGNKIGIRLLHDNWDDSQHQPADIVCY